MAGGVGVLGAIFYSLTPLFVFFFKGSQIETIYAIFLATIQELMSFVLVAIIIGFQKWKEQLDQKNKWMNYTVIIPGGYIVFMGLYSATRNVINKLRHAQIWIMSLVGLLAGPISMALLMISALYLNDGTLGNIILNTAPIYCMILSRFILKDKINKTALVGIIITSLFTFGMLFNYFFIRSEYNWKLIMGVCLSFVAALCYAFEGLVSDYFLHNDKVSLNNEEVVIIKSFFSFWVMLIIALPVISVIDTQPAYTGWKLFKTSFDEFGWVAILAYLSGIVMGTGRLCFFKTVHLSTGTYALATQLTMLIWTPVLQIIGNALIPKIETDPLAWYYWVWSGAILLSLTLVTFNQQINTWYLKKKREQRERKTKTKKRT